MRGICKLNVASCLSTCLLYFMTLNVYANYGEPFNYYLPAPSNILENVEKYHLSQGIDKFKQGKYEYAWSEFAFMLHYFPNHPKALKLIGELSIQMENPSRAERYYETALRLFPDESETHAVYGIFLHRLEKYTQATEAYQRAIALNDKAVDYHYNLGLAYYALNDFEKAHAQATIAYNKGYPLPGLKDKLKQANAWPDLPQKS